MPPKLARLWRMAPAEIAWRSGEMARTTIEYGGVAARGSKWNRRSLRRILSSGPSLAPARAAAGDDRWSEAGAALSKWFVDQPQRFVVAPSVRNRLRDDIISRFPDSEQEAVARADRVLAGSYDLLGYRGLRFDASPDPAGGAGPQIDWHSDPVHNRRAPFRFWARVPFLDPACGDHKIIWELNRHQHWLTLGRAFWLTGDDRYRSAAQRQLTWWLADNPPLIGINWASMLELAFRSVSWVWALNLFADPEDESPWTVDLLIALDRQLDHVERHL